MDETIDTAPISEEAADKVEATEGQPEPAPTARSRRPLLISSAVIIIALLSAGQIFSIATLRSSQADIQTQIEELDRQIAVLGTSVAGVSEQVEDIALSSAAANRQASGTTPAPSIPSGFLPRFSNEGQDQAIGMKLDIVEGPDAYSDSALSIDPADGKKRVWMIWAHWCPYCQQELPELNAWWPEAKADFPSAELITITTSMDDSRGNPLEPYLASSQFVFPVVVDTDTKIAAQMGVNAFPFWIVTDGDGTVLFRTAGALPIEQVERLFVQLEDFDT